MSYKRPAFKRGSADASTLTLGRRQGVQEPWRSHLFPGNMEFNRGSLDKLWIVITKRMGGMRPDRLVEALDSTRGAFVLHW